MWIYVRMLNYWESAEYSDFFSLACPLGARSKEQKKSIFPMSVNFYQHPRQVISGGLLVAKRLPSTTCWGVLVSILIVAFCSVLLAFRYYNVPKCPEKIRNAENGTCCSSKDFTARVKAVSSGVLFGSGSNQQNAEEEALKSPVAGRSGRRWCWPLGSWLVWSLSLGIWSLGKQAIYSICPHKHHPSSSRLSCKQKRHYLFPPVLAEVNWPLQLDHLALCPRAFVV